MALFKQKYRVEATRLPGWDYRSAGWYFVTICTRRRACFFGDIVEGHMRLSEVGEAAQNFWREIPQHFRQICLDEFIIMPNHIHGIVVIIAKGVETRHVASLRQVRLDRPNKFGALQAGSLPAVIHAYKAALTRWCRKSNHRDFAWQPRFYDHIIRNEKSLNEIREYIINNPWQWELDKENPGRK
jgi:REP element-mobilizing transposase RayT